MTRTSWANSSPRVSRRASFDVCLSCASISGLTFAMPKKRSGSLRTYELNSLTSKCPVWGTPALIRLERSGLWYFVVSPRAGGIFSIDDMTKYHLENASTRDKAKLSSWIQEQNEFENFPEIDQGLFKNIISRPDKSFDEKINASLVFLDENSPCLGGDVRFSAAEMFDDEIPTEDAVRWMQLNVMIESQGDDDADFILRYLSDNGFAKIYPVSPVDQSLAIEGRGYNRLDTLYSTALDQGANAFVAMWFDSSMDVAWSDGFELGISDAGFKAIRIDKKEHNNKIDDEIIAEIRAAKFIVADFTSEMIVRDGQKTNLSRGGVYYEAGFAQGLGKPGSVSV